MAFHFEKPSGFTYKAGQFGDFTLINPSETDTEGTIRGFSLTSAPYDDEIIFATRMRDTAFKRDMKKMDVGTELSLDAPYGSFTLHNNTKTPAVFLCGGIGITPVRSIIYQASHDKSAHRIFLFYANNKPEDTAFFDDFIYLEKTNPNFTFIPSMTNMEKSKAEWHGETGFFTKELLHKYIDDLAAPIYYISGPAAMVTSIRKSLNEAGINDDNIRTEEFSGY